MSLHRHLGGWTRECAAVVLVATIVVGCSKPKVVPPPPVGMSEDKPGDAAASEPQVADTDYLSYFPLNVGDRWDLVAETNRVTETMSIVALGERDGLVGNASFLEYSRDGSPVFQEGYRITKDGVLRVAAGPDGESVIDPPMPVMVPPFKPGQTWSWEGAIIDPQQQYTRCKIRFRVGDDTPIEVSGRTVPARKVEQTIEIQGDPLQTVKNTQWYAVGLGMVRQESLDGGVLTVARLQQYVPSGTPGVSITKPGSDREAPENSTKAVPKSSGAQKAVTPPVGVKVETKPPKRGNTPSFPAFGGN